MANYFVSTSGSDITGDGLSVDTAWRTIQYAVDNISGGTPSSRHKLIIAVGKYEETVDGTGFICCDVYGDIYGEYFGIAGIVTIYSYSAAVRSANPCFYIEEQNQAILIENIQVEGGAKGFYCPRNDSQADDIIIKNCTALDCGNGFEGSYAVTLLIIRCKAFACINGFYNCNYGGGYILYCLADNCINGYNYQNHVFASIARDCGQYGFIYYGNAINCYFHAGLRSCYPYHGSGYLYGTYNNFACGGYYGYYSGSSVWDQSKFQHNHAQNCKDTFYGSSVSGAGMGNTWAIWESDTTATQVTDLKKYNGDYFSLNTKRPAYNTGDVAHMLLDIFPYDFNGRPWQNIDGSVPAGAFASVDFDIVDGGVRVNRLGCFLLELPVKGGIETTITVDISSVNTTAYPQLAIFDLLANEIVTSDTATADTDTLTVSVTPTHDYVYRIWLYATDSVVGASTEFSNIKVNGFDATINDQGEIYPVLIQQGEYYPLLVDREDSSGNTTRHIKLLNDEKLITNIAVEPGITYVAATVQHNYPSGSNQAELKITGLVDVDGVLDTDESVATNDPQSLFVLGTATISEYIKIELTGGDNQVEASAIINFTSGLELQITAVGMGIKGNEINILFVEGGASSIEIAYGAAVITVTFTYLAGRTFGYLSDVIASLDFITEDLLSPLTGLELLTVEELNPVTGTYEIEENTGIEFDDSDSSWGDIVKFGETGVLSARRYLDSLVITLHDIGADGTITDVEFASGDGVISTIREPVYIEMVALDATHFFVMYYAEYNTVGFTAIFEVTEDLEFTLLADTYLYAMSILTREYNLVVIDANHVGAFYRSDMGRCSIFTISETYGITHTDYGFTLWSAIRPSAALVNDYNCLLIHRCEDEVTGDDSTRLHMVDLIGNGGSPSETWSMYFELTGDYQVDYPCLIAVDEFHYCLIYQEYDGSDPINYRVSAIIIELRCDYTFMQTYARTVLDYSVYVQDIDAALFDEKYICAIMLTGEDPEDDLTLIAKTLEVNLDTWAITVKDEIEIDDSVCSHPKMIFTDEANVAIRWIVAGTMNMEILTIDTGALVVDSQQEYLAGGFTPELTVIDLTVNGDSIMELVLSLANAQFRFYVRLHLTYTQPGDLSEWYELVATFTEIGVLKKDSAKSIVTPVTEIDGSGNEIIMYYNLEFEAVDPNITIDNADALSSFENKLCDILIMDVTKGETIVIDSIVLLIDEEHVSGGLSFFRHYGKKSGLTKNSCRDWFKIPTE